MCGICGVVGPRPIPADPSTLRAMRDVLRHRGPDGEGEITLHAQTSRGELQGWLGHRRLKIIDLSEAAHQPMTSEDGAVALVYNGEVYNFQDVRRQLESSGHRFRSTGDTEVVLRAYQEWGEDFVHHIHGMFALAIWDERQAKLLLVRDRTGKKPLYYTLRGGYLTFGSEIKSLLAAPWVEGRPDLDRLPEFLTFGYAPAPATMYEEIYQVPPASIVEYGIDGIRPARVYWDPLTENPGESRGESALANIRRLLEEAVRQRMIADVPLGAFLSGGIDSSVVVGLMAKASKEPIHTFSIGFPEEDSFDETPYARLVAQHFDTRHVEFEVKADAVALMDRLLWHHDQPYADSSAIPTYLVAQLARRYVTVALNGDGGDEVFGGYDRFRAVRLSQIIPTPLGRLARAGARLLPRDAGYYGLRRRADRFLELLEASPYQRYQGWISVFPRELTAELLDDNVPPIGNLLRSMDECYQRAAHLPVLDQIVYANFKTYLPDDLAVKMDRMSMANSLETRSPFLDTALIEYMSRLSAQDKVGLRQVKPLLRRAFWSLLPAKIWRRPKHGFGVPMNHWFRGQLAPLFEDEVLSSEARTGRFLERDVLLRLWDEHRQGVREHGPRFWTLLTLERWLRTCERPQSTESLATEPLVDVVASDP